ncbi:MAG: type II secretion system F family protein [Desulfobacterales bacterium]|nr:type II secretion system F family protein [Desulfobacterales bacterium]
MEQFRYEALDTQGKRIVKAEEARSRQELLLLIQARGQILLRWLDTEGKKGKQAQKARRSLSSKHLLQFTRDMSHLMKAELPMDRALSVIVESSTEKPIKEMVVYLKESIQGGSSLSEAMTSKSNDFSELYINMVRVGEMGGVLPLILEKLNRLLERSEEIKKFIISSSIYPIILLIVGILSLFIIMGYVVPKFASIFIELGQTIPFSTQVLISMSEFIQHWWWLIIGLITGFIVFMKQYVKTSQGKKQFDRWILKMPYLGEIMLEIQISRFCRTLGTLTQSGVPILKALSIVGAVLTNTVIKAASDYIYQQVREGKRISNLMKEKPVFPPMVVQMATLGEETGRIGEMLVSAADDLDQKTQEKIKAFLTMLEPLTILFMGLMIGMIVVSMLSTIFGINEVQF